MSETTIGVRALLRDSQSVRQEDQCDLAAFGVWWLESRDVAVDLCFAHCVTHIDALRHGRVYAIELHLEFVMAQCKDAKLALIIAVDAIRLSRRNNLMLQRRLWRSGNLRALRHGP